ncbi:hypothetical protein Q9966_010269 [Columba livia]|nr:hypothetical protein Q9966_010269 [Columba livia]
MYLYIVKKLRRRSVIEAVYNRLNPYRNDDTISVSQKHLREEQEGALVAFHSKDQARCCFRDFQSKQLQHCCPPLSILCAFGNGLESAVCMDHESMIRLDASNEASNNKKKEEDEEEEQEGQEQECERWLSEVSLIQPWGLFDYIHVQSKSFWTQDETYE